MYGRKGKVAIGEGCQTLNGEGEFQVLEVTITGFEDKPLSVMVPQIKWDDHNPEGHELIRTVVHKAVEQVLLLWRVVEDCGEEFASLPPCTPMRIKRCPECKKPISKENVDA